MQIKIVVKNGEIYHTHDCKYKISNGPRVSCGLINYDGFSLVSLIANTRDDNKVGYDYSCNISQKIKVGYYCSGGGHKIHFSLHKMQIKIVVKTGKKYRIHDCKYKDTGGFRES